MAYLGEGFSQETLGVGVKYDMFWQNTVSNNYFQMVQRLYPVQNSKSMVDRIILIQKFILKLNLKHGIFFL